MIYIFYSGKQIAIYIRSYKQGAYSTDKEHLRSHHRHYRDRSPDYYMQLGKKQSVELYNLMGVLFSQPDKHPEQLYRTGDGLLSLSCKVDKDVFKNACLTALENETYSYRFIKNFLVKKMNHTLRQRDAAPLPIHKNIRGSLYYKQIEINFNHKIKLQIKTMSYQ